MKYNSSYLTFIILLFSITDFQAQTKNNTVENAILIAEKNKNQLKNCVQLVVVYNEKKENFNAVLVVLKKKGNRWLVKQGPITAGIGKKGFASQFQKQEGDGKSPTGIFKLGKLFSYEKQSNTLLENQQTTKDDKWIDDVDSADYNKYVSGFTNAKSYENLLLKNDSYKYCMVIEYNTNPIIKGKGSAIFFHLGLNNPNSTAGCVAIDEVNMKLLIHWLDPKLNPSIIMGTLADLKSGI